MQVGDGSLVALTLLVSISIISFPDWTLNVPVIPVFASVNVALESP